MYSDAVSTKTMTRPRTVNLRIIETSDVHGCFYPYDFINRTAKGGSLARVYAYVEKLRRDYGRNLILLDNGDLLQGQPTCYYYNFIKTDEPHPAARMLSYMGYDAYTIGNHDIETGHIVYDRWKKELCGPLLGANVTNTITGKPYFSPYTIIERDGVKIAVIGLLTPAIPHWLSKNLWKGMAFEEMTTAARHWIEVVKEKEKPQVIIGLFHSGRNGGIATNGYHENSSLEVAQKVSGFDLILYGHDHARHIDRIVNRQGDSVLCLDPSCDAYLVGDAQIELHLDGNRLISKRVTGQLHDVTEEEVSENFINHFHSNYDNIITFADHKIGFFEETIRTRNSYFGNSAFIDFIHHIQLQITGAQISFAAPLTFDTQINKGDVRISDMFNLYRYENQIYVMRLSGKEIHDYLEMSYGLWTDTMMCQEDHIMLISSMKDEGQRHGFKNLAFNFDSASGIDYTVDVTKKVGEKVFIQSFSDGSPFYENSYYKVVMNSYRGNGGGELLTKGAGIPHDLLASRVLFASEHDQRYYLIKYIEEHKVLHPQPGKNWRFIPEEWTVPAIERDRCLLFDDKA